MPLPTAARACAEASGRVLHVTGITVVLVDLADDAALPVAETWLTPAEHARARRGTAAVQRRRVLLRAALRVALGKELGLAPEQVPIATTPLGRPYVVASGGAPAPDVSCSASGALGLVAVGRDRRIGVDVEAVAPWSSDVLDEGWLASDERRALALLPAADRPVAVARCWTQKEAVLKALGTGLRGSLAATVTTVGRTDGEVAGWQVHDIPVPDGWVAGLAVAPDKEIPS
jgi:4'-phosphopantetheinyl transferase